ncbi:hypothetical protein KM043_008942 [Ampulex compressa]|nr:hypothetical protein KM043_008942 [Ampulex compressa]
MSLVNLQAKLLSKKREYDRGPKISEDRYGPKTLEGNWLERRAVYFSPLDDWKTLYSMDYKAHSNDTWKDYRSAMWENKLHYQELSRRNFRELRSDAYLNNMTTTYDLSYKILPRHLDKNSIKFYNARKLKWIPEQDLTLNYGNLTEFGLKKALVSWWYQHSSDAIAKCRWQTTYRDEIGGRNFTSMERNTRHFRCNRKEAQDCSNPFKVPTAAP